MSNYQTFPGELGDSDSLKKLNSLLLPDLRGKTVLDIGCNSGFFSGYCKFSGASNVDGIDFNQNSINEAKRRFKDCNFLLTTFEELPKKKYDYILFLSAIHYANNQEKLIHSIIENNLNDDGLFVLEIGVIDDDNPAKWIEIDRGMDKRLFCNWPMINQMLATYAWKMVSASSTQKGDPTPRYTLHIRKRKNYALLLLKPSGYGKTMIARHVLNKKIQIISLDAILIAIERQETKASEKLYYAIKQNFSKYSLSKSYQLIGDLGLYDEFIDIATEKYKSSDIALEGSIPAIYIDHVREILEDKFYFLIELDWENKYKPNHTYSNLQSNLYFEHLSDKRSSIFEPMAHIDNVQVNNKNTLFITGWAFNEKGLLPSEIKIYILQNNLQLIKIEKIDRTDVKNKLNLKDERVGFNIYAKIPSNLIENLKALSFSLLIGDLVLESKIFS